jgi:hypothetical protein
MNVQQILEEKCVNLSLKKLSSLALALSHTSQVQKVMKGRRDKHLIIMNCSDSRLIDYAEKK